MQKIISLSIKKALRHKIYVYPSTGLQKNLMELVSFFASGKLFYFIVNSDSRQNLFGHEIKVNALNSQQILSPGVFLLCFEEKKKFNVKFFEYFGL